MSAGGGALRRALAGALLPAGADASARAVLASRALRAFADGCLAVLLPAYLLALGFGMRAVGVIATATLLGSALATLAVGAWGHRVPQRRLLQGAALLMAATGAGFAGLASFWPLLVVAFVGTLNPGSGDASVFVPLEQARLAASAGGRARTALYARYSVLGTVSAALGALASGLPELLVRHAGLARADALRSMFVLYGVVGLAVAWLYRARGERAAAAPAPGEAASAPTAAAGPAAAAGRAAAGGAGGAPAAVAAGRAPAAAAHAPLGPSRRVVLRLAILFGVDSFASGLVVNALLSLWLLQRFGLTLAQAGVYFFWAGLLTAASQLAAPWLASRIGLLNTMVWTHLPASVCLIAAALVPDVRAALALLFLRSLLSQMDVPTRAAYVMAVVTPAERPAAASYTAVPRSLAAAAGPALGALLLSAGWLALPLLACGVLKIGYDLALWRACRDTPLGDG